MTTPEKLPWFKWRPDKWRADAELRLCSFAARGLWIDLLGYMHEAKPAGYLLVAGSPPTTKELAKLVGGEHREVVSLLSELESRGVFSRDSAGRIYSRRMLRDIEKKEKAIAAGRQGGNPLLILDRQDRTESLNQNHIPRGERLEVRAESKAKAGQELLPDAAAPAPAPSRKSATKLPADWELPAEWLAWALSERPEWSDATALKVGLRFRDYWLSNGKRMADWAATWRNWVRREGAAGAVPIAGKAAGLSQAGQQTAGAIERWIEKGEGASP